MSNISKKAGSAASVGPQKSFGLGAAKARSKNAKMLARARAALSEMTDEEDAAIRAAALADPDAQPVDELLARRGRPKSANKKQPVMLRLDPDVLESFKTGGEGWQTRINAALRRAAGLK